jgi:hypothetical protein
MVFGNHVVLACCTVLEKLVAENTHISNVHLFCQVSQEAFEIDQALDINQEETVFSSHVQT